ncbi:alpha-galactosidase [Flagellimonas flava]|uniref:Melibiase n=1 Tax=Flagellimonas flava TaxID=570519 RepID=A0A1M5NLT6_9FLAO|nr:alpha-galactosidase [Allomuricauda flava]SHG90437.1 Melibiase [Allomuricauda flava]
MIELKENIGNNLNKTLNCFTNKIFGQNGHTILHLLFFIVWSVPTFASAESLYQESCYARLENDTLILGNTRIERQFLWNGGNLLGLAITNKDSNHTWAIKTEPNTTFPEEGSSPKNATFEAQWVAGTNILNGHLEATLKYSLGELHIKKVFRIYPDTPAIVCDIYLKGKTRIDWNDKTFTQSAMSGEEKKLLKQLEETNPFPILDRLIMPGNHWKLNVVDFKDVTDINNNLIQDENYLAFNRPLLLKGNLLFAFDQIKEEQLFVLKEAPLSNKQLYYPGYDFYFKYDELQVVGLGMNTSNIKETEWTRGYGVVIGVAGLDELGKLEALRLYQKQLRNRDSIRDEMLMMNTWGDRGQDGKINEVFAIRELEAGSRLGITHLQLDDGWQKGLSKNSVDESGNLWNQWDAESWEPHPERFPNGLEPILEKAKFLGIKLGLWFHPSDADSYKNWEQDANVLLSLYEKYGITNFKIDGIELPDKQSEINLRRLFDKVVEDTEGKVVFNLDATAGKRGGYHYLQEYGNIFLENRYTDWSNYYPHWTLRNLWMLSRYVPAENLQIEFLNKWRNEEKYRSDDPFAPHKLPFDYQFAITMMGQPLAWFEGSNLPEKAFDISPIVQGYKEVMHDIHSGIILPIGEEPSGKSWTGFQSLKENHEGYFLVFREGNDNDAASINTWLPQGRKVIMTSILGHGQDFEALVDDQGSIQFMLPKANSFALYRYQYN